MAKRKEESVQEAAKNVKEAPHMDIVDVLLDENNKDPITLEDASGKRFSFEQIAVIPYNEKLYCVLKPIDKIDGVNDDEAIVFVVFEEEGKDPVLMVETNEEIAMQVFEEYYNLLDEVTNEVKAENKKTAKEPKKSATSKSTTGKSAAGKSTKTTSSKKSGGDKSGK